MPWCCSWQLELVQPLNWSTKTILLSADVTQDTGILLLMSAITEGLSNLRERREGMLVKSHPGARQESQKCMAYALSANAEHALHMTVAALASSLRRQYLVQRWKLQPAKSVQESWTRIPHRKANFGCHNHYACPALHTLGKPLWLGETSQVLCLHAKASLQVPCRVRLRLLIWTAL